MAVLLGVDTGGTYTDAVLLDEGEDRVLARAKALTTRPDLAPGVGRAIDAVMAEAGVAPGDVALVSLSTTLATNALVEGQGGRVALVFIGFEPAELARDGLSEALRGDPVIALAGGHGHSGAEAAPLDEAALREALAGLPPGISGFAVAARFATRNPGHELAARAVIRAATGRPVTCSHELSSGLGGPRRALTAVLNARLIGMIDGLIGACEAHLARIGVTARLMVVRGDGALVSAALARERPIETILSGPAASVAGASWLTGARDALVSDIGGTTTDVCLLRDGRPAIDPEGARVGPYRTMVEAVAMRTTGLGGDSEVHLREGLEGGLVLGPRRLMPVSLIARDHPELVHRALDRALASDVPGEGAGRFVLPLWPGAEGTAQGGAPGEAGTGSRQAEALQGGAAGTTAAAGSAGSPRAEGVAGAAGPAALPEGLDPREAAVAARLAFGPLALTDAVRSRIEAPALARLVARGLVMVAGVTPSDAAHVLGLLDDWDGAAAEKALALFARRRSGRGERIAEDPAQMARAIVDRLTEQTVDCLLEAAFAEDAQAFEGRYDGIEPGALARHPLTRAAMDGGAGVVQARLTLGVPVVGLGASAGSYYGAVGARLGTRMILPEDAGVANAIGAVVGQVAMQAEGSVTSPGAGVFVAHLPEGPQRFGARDAALGALEAALTAQATARARAAGVEEMRIGVTRELSEVEVEGSAMFIEARLRVVAQGRPRIASGGAAPARDARGAAAAGQRPA